MCWASGSKPMKAPPLGPRVRRAGQPGRARCPDRVLRRVGWPARSHRSDLAPVHGPNLRRSLNPRVHAFRVLQGPQERRRGSQAVYSAPNEETARGALEEFAASDLGARYPQTVATWQRAWQRFTPFLAFPPMLRRVVYTTNAIESLNYQLRKSPRTAGISPAKKPPSNSCGSPSATRRQKSRPAPHRRWQTPNKRTGHTRLIQGHTTTNWKQALAQLTTAYPDRITPYL